MVLSDKQKKIIEVDAKINSVERVSVWLYDEEKESISTSGIYSLNRNIFIDGLTLYKKDFPIYFKALDGNSIIDAHDAINDLRTREFSETYLKPNGITSMLDVPIRVRDKVVGVICHEHVGPKRVWTKEEYAYVSSVAELFALSIETADKAKLYNALLESEQRFAFALSSLPVIFWTTDTNLVITSTRGEGVKMLGLIENRSRGLTLYELFNTDDSEHLSIAAHLRALKGESLKYYNEFLDFVFESFVEPLKNSSGEIIGCIGMAINVTERRRTDEILHKREQQLSSVFDTVADSIFVLEVEKENVYRFESINKSFTTITGIDASLIQGKYVHEIIPESSLQFVLDQYRRAITEKKVVYWEETSDYPNGKLTGIVSIAPLFDDKGKCTQLIGSVKDITERKVKDTQLKENEERFRLLAESTGIIPWESDAKTFQFTYVGPQAEGVLGYKIPEWYTTNFWPNHIHPDDREEALDFCIKSFKEKKDYEFEYRMIAADGSITWLHDVVTVQTKDGVPVTLRGYLINITERKKIEEELKKSEERYQKFAELSYEGIAIHDLGIMVQVNPALAKMFGYSEDELVGMSALELATPESASVIKANIISGSEEPYEVIGIRKNGEKFPLELRGKALEHNGKMVRVAAVRDISWRKKVENELRKSEERFRLLAETTNIIPWEIDAKTLQCTYVGPQAQGILGYPVSDWYAQDFWVNNIHPEDKERTVAAWMETYNNMENYEFEYRMIAKNGNIVWFHDVATLEIVNNEPYLLRGYLIDITARKMVEEGVQKLNIELEKRVSQRTAELQSINTELERAKVAAEESKIAKELFLASMSHEIRTPLNAIIGFQQLLKETSLSGEQKEYVESIDFAGRNLLVIVNDILDLSKIEAGKFEFDEIEFNIAETINSVIELVEYRAKEKNLKLFFTHDNSIPERLYGDSIRLGQVLLNLIGNAVKFTEHGEVRIHTKQLGSTIDSISCKFIVEDTGIGIPQDKLAFIFERFTQENTDTSRKYGGTGLGLTISKHLVEMQGGTIEVESEKGKGSVFSFELKFKKEASNKTLADARKQNVGGTILKDRKLSILLAEDVPLNQRLVVKIMERWGHDLDIAENGKVAVDKVKINTYDLVLMDIQMPIMDGYHAAAMIRSLPDEVKQKVPIVALTAHASHAEAEKCINLGMNAYLAKPFNQAHLQQIINQLTSGK